tara:strand:+ start:78 stop:521 length:444 start_codon:yes stop_codon:yes gene_type:complete
LADILTPTINLPSPSIPPPRNLPRPILDAPAADLPSFTPMYVPSKLLVAPEGITSEEEDKEAAKPQSSDLKKIEIPFTNYQMTVPREEILGAASISAVVSVATTLVATSVLKYATKIVKPVVQQVLKRIYKKFVKDGDTGKEEKSSE